MYTSFNKMDSPVQIPFKSFVKLNKDDTMAIYLQIVFEFIKVIQLGFLPEGTKLPGTRILCKILSVNRNTLIKAFQELESQGFVKILPNKGIFILSNQTSIHRSKARNFSAQKISIKDTDFNFNRSSLLENPVEISDLPLQFNDGLPDDELINNVSIARLYVAKLKAASSKRYNSKATAQVHTEFKKTVSNLLNLTRNLRISETNLLTTESHEISLYLVFKILISTGDKVVVTAPSYYLSNMTIADSGAEIISVPIDEDGISIDYLRRICETQKIRILYLTAVYHYPTTVALSAKRRIEILNLATEFNFIIVEDDYDFDFHFDNNPILPLAALDTHARVIYLGSVARSLPAGFNFGFVSAPESFITELEKHQSILTSGIDVIKEQVLTNWIQEGEIHRHLKKNKKIYKERRDFMVSLLDKNLREQIRFKVPARGLAFWIEWVQNLNLIKLKKKCAENGLFLPKTILYQTRNMTAVRLGFGSFNNQQMEVSIDILAKSIKDLNEL